MWISLVSTAVVSQGRSIHAAANPNQITLYLCDGYKF